MLLSGPNRHSNARDYYYVEASNRGLEISEDLDEQRFNESAVQRSPNISQLASMSVEQRTIPDPPTSLFLMENEDDTFDSPYFVSPTSPDFNIPTFSGVSCRACGKIFRGSSQDARSNYERHLRESLRHNPNAGLECPLPECRNRKRMRFDNLDPHLKKVHRISSKSDRQNIIA